MNNKSISPELLKKQQRMEVKSSSCTIILCKYFCSIFFVNGKTTHEQGVKCVQRTGW